MNSRPDDHEMTTASSRVSARSRFSASPSASSLLAQSNSASKSKGGINGRGSYDSDDDSEQGRTASRSSSVADRKKRGGVSGAASRELGEVERDIRLARSRSSSSAASGTSAGKDRPWRTPSSGSDRKSVRAASASSGRWSQYETEDLAEESRRATSEAASRLASRLADGAGEEVPYDPAAPMGGDAGSGYGGGGGGGGDETEALQSNGNSLPGPGTSRSSTTDYVKSRLSSLLSSRSDGPEATVDYTATNSTSNQHDRVRNEALKMLKIADSCLAESPVNSPKGSRNSSAAGSGLFRTGGGGMAMRELHPEESERMSLRRDTDVSSIKGIDKFAGTEGGVPPPPRFDGRFDVGSPSSPPGHARRRQRGGHPLAVVEPVLRRTAAHGDHRRSRQRAHAREDGRAPRVAEQDQVGPGPVPRERRGDGREPRGVRRLHPGVVRRTRPGGGVDVDQGHVLDVGPRAQLGRDDAEPRAGGEGEGPASQRPDRGTVQRGPARGHRRPRVEGTVGVGGQVPHAGDELLRRGRRAVPVRPVRPVHSRPRGVAEGRGIRRPPGQRERRQGEHVPGVRVRAGREHPEGESGAGPRRARRPRLGRLRDQEEERGGPQVLGRQPRQAREQLASPPRRRVLSRRRGELRLPPQVDALRLDQPCRAGDQHGGVDDPPPEERRVDEVEATAVRRRLLERRHTRPRPPLVEAGGVLLAGRRGRQGAEQAGPVPARELVGVVRGLQAVRRG
ncbi:hypothetical protein THAOC_36802 [Thalassiosira oceanica]|uniref:Uncharacterized protein n=1 Tax=Thalassiosira oceanica TaxID=159749 RepID=K0QZ04_THAOC|nr:hypothetical protein THAOC_36802 [Thalassiosira oceanica]|eukprot:EJK44643.1 hypothetical protein THAOC_36802 [Thalassiosira oceanica]